MALTNDSSFHIQLQLINGKVTASLVKPLRIIREKKGVPGLQEVILWEGRVENHKAFADSACVALFSQHKLLDIPLYFARMQKSPSTLADLGQTPVVQTFTF